MRILWIEDTKNQLKRKEDYFGSEIYTSHDITDISVFDEAYNAINNDLVKFDFVVIDIDLTKSDIGQHGERLREKYNINDQKTFLKTAGFDLNVQLILKGFPTQRIVFFSAYVNPEMEESLNLLKEVIKANDENSEDEIKKSLNALAKYSKNEELDKDLQVAFENKSQRGNIFSKWEKRFSNSNNVNNPLNYEELIHLFQKAHMPLPNAISKRTGSNYSPGEEIQKWFKPRLYFSVEDHENGIPLATKQYLTLRRGILNVIELLEKDDGLNLSEEFEKEAEGGKDAFLKSIKWLLKAHDLQSDSEGQFYLTLSDTLTKPFDIFTLWSKNPKNMNKALGFREPVEKSCLIPLFFLRNWIAHGLISGSKTNFGARDAAFVFLLVMKSMFKREMYGGKKEELKQLFRNAFPNNKYLMEQAFKLQNTEYKFLHEGHILRQIEKKGSKKENKNWERENYLKHFYASHLFSSFKQVSEHWDKDLRQIELIPEQALRYKVSTAYEIQITPFLDITSLMLKENIK